MGHVKSELSCACLVLHLIRLMYVGENGDYMPWLLHVFSTYVVLSPECKNGKFHYGDY